MWAKGTEFLLQKAPFNRGFLLIRSHAQSDTKLRYQYIGHYALFSFLEVWIVKARATFKRNVESGGGSIRV
ncbi:hypothetical protein GCM10011338_04050 [Alteromonas lipolytica]|nr:hypothetical protein GCM10011338_04050 [Alteromonas lipolytica]